MAQRQRSVSTQIPSVRQDHSRPFLTQKAMLNSLHAQQVFDRGYEMCANALFSLSVVLRFIGSEAQAQEVDALVDALIDQTLEDLRKESLRIREIVESNGIETAIGYTSARTVEAQITSPRAIRYLAIIREFDSMLAQMDALWLSSVVTDSQYARGVYEWKRRILRLAGQIRQIASGRCWRRGGRRRGMKEVRLPLWRLTFWRQKAPLQNSPITRSCTPTGRLLHYPLQIDPGRRP
jgi:hypothetical protein